ncbi:MAG: hypothetical protein M1825_002422 [Sarcosagium campestre]|nr:MAG: hypothetical protein M1825_002422 [Sarcosagium campestre]
MTGTRRIPVQSDAGSANETHAHEYRSVRTLPFELREHSLIYWEEELYNQAFALLNALVTAGTSSKDAEGRPTPTFVAPPQHLALIATLAIHPSLTTRASSKERHLASLEALRLLRDTNKLVGPDGARFSEAFGFSASTRPRRRAAAAAAATGGYGQDSPGSDGENDDSGGDGMDRVRSRMASSGVWARGEDFWHLVGWAFNCAVLYPARWKRWRLWLEVMLDILEDDWAQCLQTYSSQGPSAADEDAHDDDVDGSSAQEQLLSLSQSLIGRYVCDDRRRAGGGARRILRAVFADGDDAALKEFREVFANETAALRPKDPNASIASLKRKRRDARVNVDEQEYADYLDDSEEEGEGVSSDLPPDSSQIENIVDSSDAQPDGDGGAGGRSDESTDGAASLGGYEAVVLRTRLLALLSSVSHLLPTHFLPLDSLYDLYVEQLRILPLPTFSLFILPPSASSTGLPPVARTTITQFVLCSYISTSAPAPPLQIALQRASTTNTSSSSEDSPLSHTDTLTQSTLEKCYLPFAASTTRTEDNAKVSLCIEALLRLMARWATLRPTRLLSDALETGIQAREERCRDGATEEEDKAAARKKKKRGRPSKKSGIDDGGGGAEERSSSSNRESEYRRVLRASAERMRDLLLVLKEG